MISRSPAAPGQPATACLPLPRSTGWRFDRRHHVRDQRHPARGDFQVRDYAGLGQKKARAVVLASGDDPRPFSAASHRAGAGGFFEIELPDRAGSQVAGSTALATCPMSRSWLRRRLLPPPPAWTSSDLFVPARKGRSGVISKVTLRVSAHADRRCDRWHWLSSETRAPESPSVTRLPNAAAIETSVACPQDRSRAPGPGYRRSATSDARCLALPSRRRRRSIRFWTSASRLARRSPSPRQPMIELPPGHHKPRGPGVRPDRPAPASWVPGSATRFCRALGGSAPRPRRDPPVSQRRRARTARLLGLREAVAGG